MGARPVCVHGLPRQLRAVKAAIGPRRAVRLHLPLRLPEPCAQRRLRRECKRKLPHSCALFLSSSHHRISYYSTARRNFLERGLKIAKNGHTLQKKEGEKLLTLFLLTVLIYHRCFRRYDADPEPELGLPAKRLTFLSGPNRLQGYLCGTGDTLAVLAPGLGNGAFSYAPQIQWLAKAGLRVFSFDYTGCYGSTGRSCRGFPQAADDLRAALRFLEENGRFGSRRLVLLGHSMGGYAVCCALPGSRVDAAVCIGGVNSPMEATLSPVLHHIGVLAYAHYPALYLYQAARFGLRALRRTAAQAAAESGTPLLLVGGVHDWIAPLHRSSILAHLHALPQAQALLWAEPEHDGHADLLFGATRSEANPALMAQITRFLRPEKFDEMKKSC